MEATKNSDKLATNITSTPHIRVEAEPTLHYTREIIDDVTRGWNELNADLIIKHLSEDFRYDSQWVFDFMLYDEYVEYLRGKFQVIKNGNSVIKAETVEDIYLGGWMTKIIQYDGIIERQAYYRIAIENNKIIKGDLCMF